jgi:hypothetical protein
VECGIYKCSFKYFSFEFQINSNYRLLYDDTHRNSRPTVTASATLPITRSRVHPS